MMQLTQPTSFLLFPFWLHDSVYIIMLLLFIYCVSWAVHWCRAGRSILWQRIAQYWDWKPVLGWARAKADRTGISYCTSSLPSSLPSCGMRVLLSFPSIFHSLCGIQKESWPWDWGMLILWSQWPQSTLRLGCVFFLMQIADIDSLKRRCNEQGPVKMECRCLIVHAWHERDIYFLVLRGIHLNLPSRGQPSHTCSANWNLKHTLCTVCSGIHWLGSHTL